MIANILTEAQSLQLTREECGFYSWQTYGYLGLLNRLIWIASASNEIIESRPKDSRCDGFVIAAYASAKAAKPLTFRTPLTWLAEQMAEHWKGANHSRDSVRKMLRTLENWGLFTMVGEPVRFNPETKKYKHDSKLFIKFNMSLALKTHELLQQIFSAQNVVDKESGRKFITVAKHNGSFVRRLSEALLKIRYRIFGPKNSEQFDELDQEITATNNVRLKQANDDILISQSCIDNLKNLAHKLDIKRIIQDELENIKNNLGIIARIKSSQYFSHDYL